MLLNNQFIVFYDGDCGLCQRSIAFLSWADKKHTFFFAPLNGETYKHYLGSTPADLSTLLFFSNGKVLKKSDAIINLGIQLGGIYQILNMLKIIPKKVRDQMYDVVANRRQHITCTILYKDERFLS